MKMSILVTNAKLSIYLLTTLFIVTTAFFSGCSKEDEDPDFSSDYPIDGPYVTAREEGGWRLHSVSADRRLASEITTEDQFTVQSALKSDLSFRVDIRKDIDDEPAEYTTDGKILAISDLEGDLPLMIELLYWNGVINQDMDWVFGEGHLVVIGDVFDRGYDVTAMLWFIYQLEAEAEKDGGKVHLLMGNHEALVMAGDLTWARKKYLDLDLATGISTAERLNGETLLGRWLRSKNTIERINNVLFVHGGIGEEYVAKGFTVENVNELVRENIGYRDNIICAYDEEACFLFGLDGPLWYNGYFADDMTSAKVENILNYMEAEKMVIGHSKVESVQSLFNNQIIAIDTHADSKDDLNGVISESYCEGLLIENGVYYKINNLGNKGELK